MLFIKKILAFLVGSYAKFGTSSNLVREVSVSVLTAVVVAVLVQVVTSLVAPAPSPIGEVKDLIQPLLASQRKADSIAFLPKQWALEKQIDVLTYQLQKCHEADSMRANGALSTIDAMRKINGAINRASDRPR